MTLNVSLKGVDRLKRKLGASGVEAALRKGLLQGGIIVQADAQKAVHSPDNPYIGKAGRNVATGRLQASIGTSDVRGSGLGLEVRVGTPYGKAGVGTFGRSKSPSRIARSGKKIGNLTGGRRNKSDPQVYGPIEERKHPFLGPALMNNARRIRDAIQRAISAAWSR